MRHPYRLPRSTQPLYLSAPEGTNPRAGSLFVQLALCEIEKLRLAIYTKEWSSYT